MVSADSVADHYAEIRNMVGIGSGATPNNAVACPIISFRIILPPD